VVAIVWRDTRAGVNNEQQHVGAKGHGLRLREGAGQERSAGVLVGGDSGEHIAR
jgi:hypothetical protein